MPRPRALLVNEMGGGLGHAERLRRVASALACAGFHCRLGLPPCQVSAYRRFFPTIIWPQLRVVAPFSAERAASYTDLLASVGFSSSVSLRALLNATDQRFAACMPDLLITDFAPLAHLAARGQLPVISLGTGYTLPPLHCDDFPPFRDDLEPMVGDNEVLAAIAESQTLRGRPKPQHLADAFFAEASFVCCHRELDLYSQYRDGQITGMLDKLEPQPLPEKPLILAYLWEKHPHLELVVRGLVLADVPSLVYIPNRPPAMVELAVGSRIAITDQPHAIPADLQKCSVVLHAGGINFAGQALAAGRPQILIPIHIEQAINADKLAALGVAVQVDTRLQPSEIAQTIRETTENIGMAALAQSLAFRVARRCTKPLLDVIVEQALRLIQNPS